MERNNPMPAKNDYQKGFSNFAVSNSATESDKKCADISIFDSIGGWDGITARQFRDELTSLGDVSEINLHLHSPGGSVGDGLAIFNTLKSHPAKVKVHIDGWALSIASIVAMAGDEIEMADNGFMMIHNPMNMAVGDAEDMRFAAELLEKIKNQLVNTYVSRTKLTSEKISQLMDAETWLSAAEAVELGFADRCSGVLSVAAAFDVERFNYKPPKLQGEKQMSAEVKPEVKAEVTPKSVTMKELKAACPGADNDFLVAQMEAEVTVNQAQVAWMTEQNKRLESAKAEVVATKTASVQGVAPVKTRAATNTAGGNAGSGDEGDAIEQFNSAVSELMDSKKMDRLAAIRNVVQKNPQLHKDFLLASNPNRQSKRLIEEKYDQ
jgi:ATP-dependent Clp endopeptidase proteolytic subunit ClpP